MGNWRKKWKKREDYPWWEHLYISQKTVGHEKWFCVRYRVDKSEASSMWWPTKGRAFWWAGVNWQRAIDKKVEEILLEAP